MAKILQDDATCGLKVVDVTGNDFNEEDAQELLAGLSQNLTITAFDLRRNQIPKDAACLVEIAKVIRRNEISLRDHTQ